MEYLLELMELMMAKLRVQLIMMAMVPLMRMQ